jgi:hypothetical protein
VGSNPATPTRNRRSDALRHSFMINFVARTAEKYSSGHSPPPQDDLPDRRRGCRHACLGRPLSTLSVLPNLHHEPTGGRRGPAAVTGTGAWCRSCELPKPGCGASRRHRSIELACQLTPEGGRPDTRAGWRLGPPCQSPRRRPWRRAKWSLHRWVTESRLLDGRAWRGPPGRAGQYLVSGCAVMRLGRHPACLLW